MLYYDYDDLRERKNSELADVITTINGFWKIHKFQLKLNYYILIPTTTTCVARPLPLLNLRWRVYFWGKIYLIFVRTSKLLRILFLNWWTLEFYFQLKVWGNRHSWIGSWGKITSKFLGEGPDIFLRRHLLYVSTYLRRRSTILIASRKRKHALIGAALWL